MRNRRDLTWLVVIAVVAAVAMRLSSPPQEIAASPAEPLPLADREMLDIQESSPPTAASGGLDSMSPLGMGVDFQLPSAHLPIVELRGVDEETGYLQHWELCRSRDGTYFTLASSVILMPGLHEAARLLQRNLPDLRLDGHPVNRLAHRYPSREGIDFDTGTATIFKKPRAIVFAQCGLFERGFILIIARPVGDPDLRQRAERILMSMRDRVMGDHRTFGEHLEDDRKSKTSR